MLVSAFLGVSERQTTTDNTSINGGSLLNGGKSVNGRFCLDDACRWEHALSRVLSRLWVEECSSREDEVSNF